MIFIGPDLLQDRKGLIHLIFCQPADGKIILGLVLEIVAAGLRIYGHHLLEMLDSVIIFLQFEIGHAGKKIHFIIPFRRIETGENCIPIPGMISLFHRILIPCATARTQLIGRIIFIVQTAGADRGIFVKSCTACNQYENSSNFCDITGHPADDAPCWFYDGGLLYFPFFLNGGDLLLQTGFLYGIYGQQEVIPFPGSFRIIAEQLLHLRRAFALKAFIEVIYQCLMLFHRLTI